MEKEPKVEQQVEEFTSHELQLMSEGLKELLKDKMPGSEPSEEMIKDLLGKVEKKLDM